WFLVLCRRPAVAGGLLPIAIGLLFVFLFPIPCYLFPRFLGGATKNRAATSAATDFSLSFQSVSRKRSGVAAYKQVFLRFTEWLTQIRSYLYDFKGLI